MKVNTDLLELEKLRGELRTQMAQEFHWKEREASWIELANQRKAEQGERAEQRANDIKQTWRLAIIAHSITITVAVLAAAILLLTKGVSV